jgi:hypothetical protein
MMILSEGRGAHPQKLQVYSNERISTNDRETRDDEEERRERRRMVLRI